MHYFHITMFKCDTSHHMNRKRLVSELGGLGLNILYILYVLQILYKMLKEVQYIIRLRIKGRLLIKTLQI